MENPHEEKQAVYLERIIKNAVSNPAFFVRKVFQPVLTPLNTKDKCLEAIKELNASIEAICVSNHDVQVASELFENYRRNVSWNLKQHPMPEPVMLEQRLPNEPPESPVPSPKKA
ncbi:hypothetical protein FRC04_010482 [Tulasnella sp. 424]|nr:hypothetical protein FRC04_010482 [Tulasnella sp. 424]KAG8960126.1 hypothetical protein FRC05_007051 [Tulasnella sp. 425]